MKKIKCMVALLTALTSFAVSAAPPVVDSRSNILVEKDTGAVICEKNSKKQYKIASLTKIMTVLLTLEAIDRGETSLDDTVVCSPYAASMGGSQIYLKEGEKMSVNDIIKAVMVASANDAAIALAEHVGGTYEEFVERMNLRAAELGMKNTHYADANGLSDSENHYSTAEDLAILSTELLKHEEIKNYTMIWMDKLRDGDFDLNSTNLLLKSYKGITGLKTGYTSEALYCMVASAERDGKSYIAVVLGAPTTEERFEGSERLLDYAFNDIRITDRIEKGSIVGETKIIRGRGKGVKAKAKEQIDAVLETNMEDAIRNVVFNDVTAPVKKGDVLGKVEFVSGDVVVSSTELVATEDVKKKNFFSYVSDFGKAFAGIF